MRSFALVVSIEEIPIVGGKLSKLIALFPCVGTPTTVDVNLSGTGRHSKTSEPGERIHTHKSRHVDLGVALKSWPNAGQANI